MHTVEFEIKSFLKDKESLHSIIKAMRNLGEVRVIDHYFDNQETKLFELSVFIRIRNNKKLDIKYDKDKFDLSHTICNELSFDYPLSEDNSLIVDSFLSTIIPKVRSTGDIFKQYNLQEFVVIDRLRQTYQDDHVLIMLDSVKDLGNFIEIEADQGSQKHVRELVKILGLEPIPLGYVELFLRQHNFLVYQKGKFLLAEDRK